MSDTDRSAVDPGSVDYGDPDAAERYAVRRTLPPDVMQRWRQTVQEALTGHEIRSPIVLDVGAGTGGFSRDLAEWTGGAVAAIEPSVAMFDHAFGAGVTGVRARGQALPIADDSVDVVWLSAVLHHLGPIDAALGEISRVLRPGGLVLVRGFFADRRPPTAIADFPGIERAIAPFPTTTAVRRAAATCGLAWIDEHVVSDTGPATVGAAIERVEEVRHVDTLLAGFTDDDLAQGLAQLRRRQPNEELIATDLSLLVLRKS